MYRILDNIGGPEDVRALPAERLEELCGEVRDYIIRCCADNPGHLGSSLGAVELCVALHYVYDTPEDKIVFDVGHQAYAHKILTGRRESFRQNRMPEGLSGFPNMSESRFDAFGAGHSSTSVSAALGLAEAARRLSSGEKVVAVIGDGAMTGGMAFEGLNNASDEDVLIILNDNNQSIDKNTGGFHDYLLRLTTDQRYNSIKRRIWDTLGEGRFRSWVQKMTLDTKSNLVRGTGGALFEALGIRYFGPVDGNNVQELVQVLSRLRPLKGPRLLHIHTVKGKGFAPAEADPTTWHAPGKFNPETGERIPAKYAADRYQDVFGQTLVDLARLDERVVGVTPAMATGCGMTLLATQMPERFHDVGIAEEHAVTFSAGMAAGGLRPFCNIYSSFSQRAYDQIIHDVALQKLPVVLCFDRAGLVGEDGATHQGSFDLAAFRSIPGVTICAPRNESELRNMMYSGLRSETGPFIIRYPRGCGEGTPWRDEPMSALPVGKGQCLREGADAAVLALGPMANRAVEAAEAIKSKTGAEVAVYDIRFLKPFDEDILVRAKACGRILTVEDGTVKGGLYSEVAERLAGSGIPVRGLGIPDSFIHQDRQSAQRHACGLDTEGITKALEELLKA